MPYFFTFLPGSKQAGTVVGDDVVLEPFPAVLGDYYVYFRFLLLIVII